MTQDKTLREQFLDKFQGLEYMAKDEEIADFYEDKIKSVVREMKKTPEIGMTDKEVEMVDLYNSAYNQFGDDLLERLGIK
jgi:hypothetical protein